MVSAVSTPRRTPRGKAPNRGGVGPGLAEGQSYSCQPSLAVAQAVSIDLPTTLEAVSYQVSGLKVRDQSPASQTWPPWKRN